MRVRWPRAKSIPIWAVLLVLVLSVGFAACGDDDDDSSSDGGSAATANDDASGGAGASGDAMARAKEAIEPYFGQASPLPDLPPLEELPTGKTVFLMNQGAPEVRPHIDAATAALKTLGMKTRELNAGTSASSVTAAFDTAVQQKPDAVMDFAIPPQLFAPQAKQLIADGVVVSASASPGAEELGLLSVLNDPALEKAGKLIADYMYTKQGDDLNAVFYNVPEIAFSPLMAQSWEAEMNALCPDCTARVTDIPASSLGSTAASEIVSDLQANPDTNWAVMSLISLTLGLPQQMRTAGIEDIDIITFTGGNFAYEALKNGDITADFGISIPELLWSWSDAVARALAGQEVPKSVTDDLTPTQILEPKDITWDPKDQFTPDPDYQEHFKELWGL